MLALTVGVLAILGVAVGWTVLNHAGSDPTPPGGDRASGTALPARPGASTAGDHLGTTSDQASLARVVPSELAGRCDPANVADPRIAAVTCTTADGYVVAYEAYPSRSTLDDDWRAMLRERELAIDDGACESGKPGEAGWYYTDGDPDLDEGRDACFLDVAGPVLVWTDYVTRTRTWLYGPADTSIEATFERWNEGDLDPVRSGDGSVPQPRSGRPS